MTTTETLWIAAWLSGVMIVLLAPRSHAGIGELDVRFGTNGVLEVTDPYEPSVLVQPDGKLLAVGNLRTANGADRRYLVLARWLADGRPDAGYGQGGRILVPASAWNDGVVEAAAIQPDGRIVLAGACDAGPSPGVGRWVRFVARIDASGNVDQRFGTGGFVDGGEAGPASPMFGPGYGALRVLPNGDILAVLNDGGHHVVDRFDRNGRQLAGTPFQGAVIDLAADSGGAAIVLLRRNFGGTLSRLLPNGEIDRGFGNQGYAELRDTSPTALATDLRGRTLVCATAGILAYDSLGRVDKSFGSTGDGWVSFNDRSLPGASACAIAVVQSGGPRTNRGDVIVLATDDRGGGRFTTAVAQLDADGRIDAGVGGGKGWQVIGTRQTPGITRSLQSVQARGVENPVAVWQVSDFGESSQVVQALDLGNGERRGAAGVTEHPLPFNEFTNQFIGGDVLSVIRSGPPRGGARVRYEMVPGTAAADDVALHSGELRWADGDDTMREIPVPVINDDLLEGEETFRLRLFDASGIDVPQEFTTFTIVDDDALRALRFEETLVKWSTERGIPASAWPHWNLHLDVAAPGPVTVHHYLANGLDGCCLGRLRWAAGERGMRSIATYPGEQTGLGAPGYYVALIDGTWREIDQYATIELNAPPTPPAAPPPPQTGGSPFNPTPNPNAGDRGGGGGAFDDAAAAALLALLLGTRVRSRRRLR